MFSGSMDTLNAKRMTADQVASTFVVPGSFDRLTGQDHVYVIGPRGSGKTTLLRMLTGENLTAWTGPSADSARRGIRFSSVFLPADELWASQTTNINARAAFSSQLFLALVDTLLYRLSGNSNVHLPATISPQSEAALTAHFAKLWGLENVVGGFHGLQAALELFLARLEYTDVERHPFAGPEVLRLFVLAVQAFNRSAGQTSHPWALLLDEMELAPAAVHEMVTSFVRGGSPLVTLKISMSPFDRYMDYYGDNPNPAPGHDFQTVYLSGQPTRDLKTFTQGLWAEALRARGLPQIPLMHVLSASETSRREDRNRDRQISSQIASMADRDESLRVWLLKRGVNAHDISSLNYNERSSTVRKIMPLIVYRDALLNFRGGRPLLRSRKKSFEPFTGPSAVVTVLEGNPRWIKSAFAFMLDYYDVRAGSVSRGFQFDALTSVASRFEALLRVLPTRQGTGDSVPPLEVVDVISRHLRDRNLGPFSADAPNSFTVDARTSDEVRRALLLGLYAGAIVHIRDRKSPAVLSSFTGQRFRLTHLLSIRDGKELPLRLGKDVSLSSVLARPKVKARPSELPIDWSDA